MNACKSIAGFAFAAACTAAMAAEAPTDTTREERMDAALQNYRDTHPDAGGGPFARAEESVKHGARRASEAIKHGAHKAGAAIGHGVRKTGDAIGRTGEKMEGGSKAAP